MQIKKIWKCKNLNIENHKIDKMKTQQTQLKHATNDKFGERFPQNKPNKMQTINIQSRTFNERSLHKKVIITSGFQLKKVF